MAFSKKQQEYLNCATHRWNIKSGATRSGKTYLDYFVIPKRLRAASGKDGLVIILGNTKGTLQRNIIEPLQKMWGEEYVSSIRADNTAILFGEKVYCLGADKISQVDRLRGSSIKYCYGDEVVTWHKDVFTMLKSRLDKSYSKFDGTCNPENPKHWFKQFIDSDADIFLQNYAIDDNPFLSEDVKENLKREYFGTVFYDRYILGKWVNAEGLIYPLLADNPERYIVKKSKLPELHDLNVGVDWGGNTSGHAITLSGIGVDGCLYFLKSDYRKATGTTAENVIDWCVETFERYYEEYPYLFNVYADSAEQVLKNSIAAKSRFYVYNSLKKPIIDRIRLVNKLLAIDRVKFVEKDCDALIEAFSEALWDEKSLIDRRLDDNTTNIDSIDSAEYSFEYNMHFFEKI